MARYFLKVLYVIVRTSACWSWPGLRKCRNWIYSKTFSAVGISVGDFVLITAAHPSDLAKIAIGPEVEIARNVTLDYSGGLTIGRGVAVSEGAKVFTHNHQLDGSENWHLNGIAFSPLEIGSYVWIGAGVTIVERVTRIGRGAVIGAGAVVTSDVEDFEIVGGVPARKVGTRKLGE